MIYALVGSCGRQDVGTVSFLAFASEGLNVAPEGLAQDAAWWLYLLFTGFQEVPEPPLGTSLSNLTGLTDLGVWKEGRSVLGVFLFKDTGI